MKPFQILTGVAAPLPRVNVDTDQIIPKQFLKTVKRTGLGAGLFYDFRFKPDGTPDPTFVLNQPAYKDAKILVGGANFGCGSSREHAPWALLDFGISCVIAPSFADIFFNNCFKNGVLPLALPDEQVQRLMALVTDRPGTALTVDLRERRILGPDGAPLFNTPFPVDPDRRRALLEGEDEITTTESRGESLDAFEAQQASAWPWVRTRA